MFYLQNVPFNTPLVFGIRIHNWATCLKENLSIMITGIFTYFTNAEIAARIQKIQRQQMIYHLGSRK